MKTCFSIIYVFFSLSLGVLAQEETTSANRQIRDILLELSIKIQNLESIFLVPGNMYIENGDASLALVELEKLQVLMKKIEGKVETMEYEMRSQINSINILNQKISAIIGDKENFVQLGLDETKFAKEQDNESNSVKEMINQENNLSEVYILGQGKNFFNNGEFREAKKNYEKFINIFPDSPFLPEVFILLAETFYKIGEWKNAANSYLEAFSLEPKGTFAPQALFGLAISLGALKEFDQACLTLDEVHLRFPSQNVISESEIMETKGLLNCP